MTQREYTPIKSIEQMDKFIIDNWKFFNNGSGYSNCTTDLKKKFTRSTRVNTIHNCHAWAIGRYHQMRGVNSKEGFVRPNSNPYEFFSLCKQGKFPCAGTSTTKPKVGALVIWGKPSASDGKSRSHIGVIEEIKNDVLYVSEDNYSTLRVYGGKSSYNGIRTLKANASISSSLPFVGYVLPEYEYVTTEKVKPAKNKDNSLNKNFKVVNCSSLRMRTGAGTQEDIITTLPKNSKVRCYGYYTPCMGVKWLLVEYNGISGYCSEQYLL